jgi:hypothetical protein
MTAPASGTEARINPGRCQQHHRRVWWVIRPPERAPRQPPKQARLGSIACTPSRQARREIRIRAFGWKTQPLHLIMDNYAAHKHPKVRAWLAANPQDPYPLHPDLGIVAEPCRGVVRHYRTPSYPPGRVSLRPRPHDQDPGVHHGWNGRCQPFVWIKTAEQILTKPTVKQLQLRPTSLRMARGRADASEDRCGCCGEHSS